ncbi:hypothetical protein BZB76_1579 [Actinomadura pelletieri DSM 43383]|uniref:Uncharacterized protein n=1 Tax=Actinomadura pelletieri DSM 43383 TaxID=1120940 RepID=A0A495QRW0_9ACTN|nr:hypothetical protein BZB76_1579 [Actinomadura pelletieri DSM 43383]
MGGAVEAVLSMIVVSVYRTDALLMESRQMIGLAAAVLAAMLAAQLGWHGTDRLLAWRGRSED